MNGIAVQQRLEQTVVLTVERGAKDEKRATVTVERLHRWLWTRGNTTIRQASGSLS